MGIIDNLEALLKQGKDSAMLRYGLGGAYLNEGDHAKALDHLGEAVRQDPTYSAAWKLYGKALDAAGRHQEAVDAFDQGIAAAEKRGDVQAAKEMRVFRKRAVKALGSATTRQRPPDH